VRLCVLVGLVLLLWTQREFAPVAPRGTLLAAVGFLLLAGTLGGELSEVVRLPQLTGFLLVGVLVGPHVLRLVDATTSTQLSFVNTLALSLIALAGGAELRLEQLRAALRSLAWATLLQSILGLVASAAAFMALARMIPFARALPTSQLIGIALVWGVFSVSRSPSATLAILSQTRADGPVTRFSLAFVMLSDIVVVVLLTTVMMFIQPLMSSGATFSLSSFGHLGHEVLSSVSLGTTLGLVLAIYLRLVGEQLLLVLVAVGFALSEGLRYLRFDPLLTFVIAGFVIQNWSKQGEKLLHAIENTGTVVYVVFFATAGVALDLPLLKQLWPVALALSAVRMIAAWLSHRASSRAARDEPSVRRWGWTSMLSQAGLTLGLAAVVEAAYPALRGEFRSLVIATVAINQVFGPVVFKLALEKSGEARAAAAEAADTDVPPASDGVST